MHSACFWKCWDLLDQGYCISCFVIRDCTKKNNNLFYVHFHFSFEITGRYFCFMSDDSGLGDGKKFACSGLLSKSDLVY